MPIEDDVGHKFLDGFQQLSNGLRYGRGIVNVSITLKIILEPLGAFDGIADIAVPELPFDSLKHTLSNLSALPSA